VTVIPILFGGEASTARAGVWRGPHPSKDMTGSRAQSRREIIAVESLQEHRVRFQSHFDMPAMRQLDEGRAHDPSSGSMSIMPTGHWRNRPQPGIFEIGKDTTMTRSTDADFYYQLVLLWLEDAARFETYCQLLHPVVEPYGGALDVQLRPNAIYAAGLERPDVVNFVHYSSRTAYGEFLRDQRFREIVHLRSTSTRMLSVEGTASKKARGRPAERGALHVVEIARFGPRGISAYRQYEEEAEPVMARYGYHVAHELHPDSASGFGFEPDIVKVAYFDSQESMDQLNSDPAHSRIEGELYPAAVAESVWIIGPSTAP
jgi:uncharacterized protein (DUF1330 family)